jgi:hypothetical protein
MCAVPRHGLCALVDSNVGVNIEEQLELMRLPIGRGSTPREISYWPGHHIERSCRNSGEKKVTSDRRPDAENL